MPGRDVFGKRPVDRDWAEPTPQVVVGRIDHRSLHQGRSGVLCRPARRSFDARTRSGRSASWTSVASVFFRVFARSVGVTPHRYIVHLRLRRAIELVHKGRFGWLTSQLPRASPTRVTCRVVRRVNGASLTQLGARPRSKPQESSRSVAPVSPIHGALNNRVRAVRPGDEND